MNSDTVERTTEETGREAELVQQVNKTMCSQNDEDRATHLKRKINNLLWEELPDNVAMSQAEIIACKIFRLIKPNS